MISQTGDGLSALIRCEYLPHHNWMSFVSWYSISKKLPDAEVAIYCDKRQKSISCPLFSWVNKLKVSFSYSLSKIKDFNCEITCDWMAIDLWDESNLFGEIKSNNPCTFCSFKDGCGDFVMSEWIDKLLAPFAKVDSFEKKDLFVNEAKVLGLWRKATPIYSAVW